MDGNSKERFDIQIMYERCAVIARNAYQIVHSPPYNCDYKDVTEKTCRHYVFHFQRRLNRVVETIWLF